MTDASLEKFDPEYRYCNEVLSDARPLFFNKIFQTAVPGLKYRPSDMVTKFTQVYEDANGNTIRLTVQI